jgi:hypothetical protein
VVARALSSSLAFLMLVACHTSSTETGTEAGTPEEQGCEQLYEVGRTHGASTLTSPFFVIPPVNCPSGPVPADTDRVYRAQFLRLCSEAIAMPGSYVTAAWLDVCADDLSRVPCGGALPASCTAPKDAGYGTCCSDLQCASLMCLKGDAPRCIEPVALGGGCYLAGQATPPVDLATCVLGARCTLDPDAGLGSMAGLCTPDPGSSLGDPGQTPPPAWPGQPCASSAGRPCFLSDTGCGVNSVCPALLDLGDECLATGSNCGPWATCEVDGTGSCAWDGVLCTVSD